jgi:hypothetical protein
MDGSYHLGLDSDLILDKEKQDILTGLVEMFEKKAKQ